MPSTRGVAVSCIVALAAAALVTGCGGAQSRFASHMKRGQTLFSQNDFTTASIEFRNAMQIEPKDDTARLMAGRSAERLGHPREALGLYQSVVDSTPENVDARVDLGRVLVYGGAVDPALKVIEPALAKHPDNAALLTLRAAARIQLKNEAGAVADADRALQLAPTNEDAIQVRAGLYKRAGDISGATALVSEAVRKLPSSTTLREMLADLYMNAGEHAKAEEQLRGLIGLAPQEPRFRYQLAIFYSRARRLDEAQRVLEATVKAMPKSVEAKLALADFVSTQRAPAQGAQVLRGFIAKEPSNEDLRLGLASQLQHSGATREAVDTYNEVIQRDGTGPKGLIARDRLAVIAWSQGRVDDARKLIEQVLEKNPHDNEALTRRAEIALSRTDPAAAIGDLRAVLRDQPQAVGIRRLLARAYAANGQSALAEETLRTSIDLAPNDMPVRIELAQLLIRTQRPDQAATLLEEAAHRTPADATVRAELARAYVLKKDFASAKTAAQDLETLRPTSATGPYLAGLAAEGENQPEEAQKDYERALGVEPQAFDPLSALARLELSRGQGAQAIARVKDAAQHDPSNAQVFNLLGELYLEQRNVPLATDALTHVITLAPKWWVGYRNLALAKLAAQDTAGAIATYESGIKVAAADPKLVSELALLYESNGRADDAIKLFDTLNRQNPRAEGIANNLAMLLVTYKNDRASLDRARDLTTGFASSSDGRLLDTNGWVHFKRAEYTDALAVLQRAIDRTPDAKEIRYHLGMVELSLGQTDRARSDLETAVSGSAKFVGSDEARTILASLNKDRTG